MFNDYNSSIQDMFSELILYFERVREEEKDHHHVSDFILE